MVKTFAVIGLGRMGYRTVLAGRAAGLELCSILDSAETPWGVTQDAELAPFVVSAFDDMIARGPDVVAISTTADSHYKLFNSLADAGIKTLLVEKPVACSVAHALAMAKRADQNTMQVLVNHNHRAWSVLHKIRAFDGDPRFGKLKSFTIVQGAGGIGNLGTHYFDLANWMFDANPTQVVAFGTQPEAANPRGAQFLDLGGTVMAAYPDKLRLVLEIGDDVGVIGGYEFRYEFGRVLMPFTSEPPRVFIRKPETREMPKHFYGAALEELPWDGFVSGDVVVHTTKVFEDLLTGNRSSGATLRDAAKALEMTAAARLSIERNTIMTLPLQGDDIDRVFSLA